MVRSTIESRRRKPLRNRFDRDYLDRLGDESPRMHVISFVIGKRIWCSAHRRITLYRGPGGRSRKRSARLGAIAAAR